jgi:hypothetical protein
MCSIYTAHIPENHAMLQLKQLFKHRKGTPMVKNTKLHIICSIYTTYNGQTWFLQANAPKYDFYKYSKGNSVSSYFLNGFQTRCIIAHTTLIYFFGSCFLRNRRRNPHLHNLIFPYPYGLLHLHFKVSFTSS